MDLDPNDHPPIDRAASTNHPPAAEPLSIPSPCELRQLRAVDLTPRIDAALRAAVDLLRKSMHPDRIRAAIHEELPVLEAVAARLRSAGWACAIEAGGFRDGGRLHTLNVVEKLDGKD